MAKGEMRVGTNNSVYQRATEGSVQLTDQIFRLTASVWLVCRKLTVGDQGEM